MAQPVVAPLFRAIDRGIVVGAIYAAILILTAEENGVSHAAVWALCGFIAGAIGACSNSLPFHDFGRDVARNLLDALMIVIWTTNLILIVHYFNRFHSLDDLAELCVVFAIGTLMGGLIGEPILRGLALVEIRGVRPFGGVNELADLMQSEDLRFVTKVVGHSVVFAVLATIAILLFLGFVALMILRGLLLLVWAWIKYEWRTRKRR